MTEEEKKGNKYNEYRLYFAGSDDYIYYLVLEKSKGEDIWSALSNYDRQNGTAWADRLSQKDILAVQPFGNDGPYKNLARPADPDVDPQGDGEDDLTVRVPAPASRPMLVCPVCRRLFGTQAEYEGHYRSAHVRANNLRSYLGAVYQYTVTLDGGTIDELVIPTAVRGRALMACEIDLNQLSNYIFPLHEVQLTAEVRTKMRKIPNATAAALVSEACKNMERTTLKAIVELTGRQYEKEEEE